MTTLKYLDKQCAFCESKLIASTHRSDNERARRDEKKKYCNDVCSNRGRAKPRICAGLCGEILVKRRGETPAAFRNRKGCGNSQCGEEIRYKAKRQSRKNNAKSYYQVPDIMEMFNRGML